MPLFTQGARREIEQRGVSPNLQRRFDFDHARRSVAMDDQEVRGVQAPVRQVEAQRLMTNVNDRRTQRNAVDEIALER